MKPYYEHAGITIFHGDCREVLKCLPVGRCGACSVDLADESILAIHLAAGHAVGPFCDLLLTDPPYGIGYASNPIVGKGKAASNHESMEWDEKPASDDLLGVCRAKCETQMIWGGNYFSLPPSRRWLVWHKPDAPPSMSRVELAWTNMDSLAGIFHWSIAATDGQRVGHCTQKPLELMNWCVSLAPDNVQTVLDPFAGSGTSLVSAKTLGKSAIGIEIEEKYCEIAAKRLSQEVFDFTGKP